MEQLNDWFKRNQRSFPWRENRTPYKVWISEVMLQQTRASVVVPYFLRWIQQFPDLKTLSSASPENVIKAWEGLGYYSRARNLHKGAQQIVEQFDGILPDSKEALSSIRGLGPYTVGAILSFGFHRRAAAVDGNVTRVVSRYFAIDENICRSAVKKRIEHKTESLLDEKEPWTTAEALIELGATICLPKPRCEDCPLQGSCLGQKLGIAESLPIKNEEKGVTILDRTVAVIVAQGRFLVRKGEMGKVMADLYEFPYFEEKSALEKLVKKRFGFLAERIRLLQEVTHTFTRYKARLRPVLLAAALQVEIPGWIWVEQERLADLPFSSGHRMILRQL